MLPPCLIDSAHSTGHIPGASGAVPVHTPSPPIVSVYPAPYPPVIPQQGAAMAAKPITRSDKTPSDLLDASVLGKVEKKDKEKKQKLQGPDKTTSPTPENNVNLGQMEPNSEPSVPAGGTPPNPQGPPKDHLANAVMGEFSSLWETFKSGVESQLLKFSETLNDPKEGLVTKMKDMEKEISKIRDGTDGELGLTEQLNDFKTRLAAVESRPTGTITSLTDLDERLQEMQAIKNQLDTLEEKCTTPGAGLCKDVSTVQNQVTELVSIINEIATKDEADIATLQA